MFASHCYGLKTDIDFEKTFLDYTITYTGYDRKAVYYILLLIIFY